MSGNDLPLLVVLLGPTASGKTVLSLEIAECFSGEIVSCDSVAVYRELEIGTAKPSLAERQRIPHHMIDVADPSQAFSAGDYSRLARRAIAGISGRIHLPVITGGAGLYLRAVIDGLFPGPARSEGLRNRLRDAQQTKGAAWLHRILSRIDPEAAELIHPNDTPKLIRAIEVGLAARQPMTQAWKSGRNALEGYRILRIGLDPERKALYKRIDERAAAMFDQGLVEETRQIAERYGKEVWGLSSLGYRQAMAVLLGTMSLGEAVVKAQQGHRNYAKRQMTWFRREPDVHWLSGFGDETGIFQLAKQQISQALGEPTHAL